ncbi:MAG: N-6 DNA methylase [Chloroflexi bacterium]|nr:N-6 DNA methylase [Chloroflexota bacterium]MCI0647496.1 N-6 DNA methylase [Chloroflexota bacterium]MCI0728723.1 N-6 DNA methylase [Chloroflexota bacterium]
MLPVAGDGRIREPICDDPVAYSFHLGQALLAGRSERQRKQSGQFLTPLPVARYMAKRLGSLRQGCRVLDPAIGSGVLACALVESIVQAGFPTELTIEGYEIDRELAAAAREALAAATTYAAAHGVRVQTQLHQADFVLAQTATFQPSLFPAMGDARAQLTSDYDVIIANPPYFKLNVQDPRAQASFGLVAGHTNIYTLFMALGVELLADNGQACFIVPRSFCSGAYFAKFRRELIQRVTPSHVHLFESRQEAFKPDDVLQENVIITFSRRPPTGTARPAITISASPGTPDLQRHSFSRQISLEQFLGQRNGAVFFRLPVTELDQAILAVVDGWPGSLERYGWQVSTGPVVPFRARSLLRETEAVGQGEAVPLLWMHHVTPASIAWPVAQGNKPQAIATAAAKEGLLLPAANYVLTRRFSAKEERRRLVAAPLLRGGYSYDTIGLENHLNVIYRQQGELAQEEALGLSALLNSALVDRYFRISNGNTQVNAAELRALPLPPLEVIRQIGSRVATSGTETLNQLVFAILRETDWLPADFPTIDETRFSMGKIQEAQDLLKALGLPKAQQNEMAALTLLVLAQLSEETPWAQARSRVLRIHDILLEIQARYGRQYAENTRETIRRQVIHQFVQAGLVLRNPDDLALPTNSPRTHYALSEPALETIRAYDSESWPDAAQSFLENQRALIETYHQQREQHKVPLVMEGGLEYHLSPGLHNELQVAIIEEFGPRFAPGAKVLYVGDTANKTLHIDLAAFDDLGMTVTSHDKLPDVVLYDRERNWLYLIEAVTSHGPISPKRQVELQEMLKGCPAGVIFVTAFPDFNTFKNFLFDVAWDTEVWIADRPTHLVHFNGNRFLGPRS